MRARFPLARSLLSALVVLAVLGGVAIAVAPELHPPATSSSTDPGSGPVRVDVGVQRALRTWGEAVRDHDRTSLREGLDARADPAFVRSENERAAALRDVPLSEWSYTVEEGPDHELPDGLARAIGADEVWAPPVVLRYAIAGADERPTRRQIGVVLARRGPTWRVLADSVAGAVTWRGPWDFGAVTAIGTTHGVVLGHPEQRARLETLAVEVDSAVPAVTALWGRDWPQRAVVVLPGSQEELQALIGADFASPGVAAVTISDEVDVGAATATGVRVVFNPATFDEMSGPTRRIVLRHELTHAATRSVTAPRAPLWLLEGYADYSGYRGSTSTPATAAPRVAEMIRDADRSAPAPVLPADRDFAPGAVPGTADLAYQLSWTFSLYIAREHGEQVLTDLYRSLAGRGDPSPEQLDAAFTDTVGVSFTQAQDGWRSWLRRQLG